jgi:hypothetical protein|tara:strand:- start:5506 stop:5652 length:147 start_codon:yes stop_codon:yes gene_type:complete
LWKPSVANSVYYSIANPKIVAACQLMREVLIEQLEDMSRLRQEYADLG